MKLPRFSLFILAWLTAPCGAPAAPVTAAPSELAAPRPYTAEARAAALALISDHVAVFDGSRYAYVRGAKVRLDEGNLRDGEAELRDAAVFVPARFLGVLVNPAPQPDAVPADLAPLADRWVHTLGLPPAPAVGPALVDFASAARAAGLAVSTHPRGVVLAGPAAVDLAALPSERLDALITLFDTPEKFADPAIATRSLATLTRQGPWTEHARATSEQLAALAQPEVEWPTVPAANYDFTGFNAALLGSAPPPPGEYPRILFSAADVPDLAARLRAQRLWQLSLIEIEELFRASWWDPSTSDGALFVKLAAGDTTDLKLGEIDWSAKHFSPANRFALPHVFNGQKPGIYNSHVAYLPECLGTMALYCLLTGDDARGRQTAAAIATYFRLREPAIDAYLAVSDADFGNDEFKGSGAATHWRGMHALVSQMNLGLCLDFAGKWMTPAEKDLMRRVIAKATYGRRSYGQDGPVRFRDVNWVTWDLPHFLALCAIEGLPGFDAEGYAAGAETVRAFLDWGIDRHGQIYESNGKNVGGLQFQLLSMVALARRGENLFGHPHWRALPAAQVQTTSPTGRVVVSGGTFSGSALSFQFLNEYRAFHPGERAADFLLSQPLLNLANNTPATVRNEADRLAAFDADAARAALRAPKGLARLRLPSPTYPAFTRSVLYDTDWTPATRADLGLPLDYVNEVHGVFSAYSDREPSAAWMNLLVRPNHYMGAGHHHSDAGMFHFSAHGVDWIAESPFSMSYPGKYHNQVVVDGESQSDQFPSRAAWLGASTGPVASAASADLTYAYSWRWLTQPNPTWEKHHADAPGGWEVEPAADILRLYQGTARYKMRPWWSTYAYSNWTPTLRAPFNPMRRVFRTVALVRGSRPYGVVVDDVKKDDATRLYEWTACPVPGVGAVELPGLPAGWLALGHRDQPADRAGSPILLVVPLADPAAPQSARIDTLAGPPDRSGKPQTYERINIPVRAAEMRYRVLLLPHRVGSPMPVVTYDPAASRATVDGDELRFTVGADERTRFAVTRAGASLLVSP